MLKSELIIEVAALKRGKSWYQQELIRQSAIKDATIQHALDSKAEIEQELNSQTNTKMVYWAVGVFTGVLFGLAAHWFYLYDGGF